MIFMGQLTDTFVEYEMWNGLTKLRNDTLYNTALKDTNNSQFLDFMYGMVGPDLKTVQIRLKLENETFSDKLRETVFLGNGTYVDDFTHGANKWSLAMVGVGAGFLICGYIMVATMSAAANNQIHRIRIIFFKAILKQDITYFDTRTSGDFASKVTGYDFVSSIFKFFSNRMFVYQTVILIK